MGDWLSLSPPTAIRSQAEVRVPTLIVTHGHSRDQPVHIWGDADRMSRLLCLFRGHPPAPSRMSTDAGAFYLPPAKVGGPYELEIRGPIRFISKTFWLETFGSGSGQSNMGSTWPGRSRNHRAAAPITQIAYFMCSKNLPIIRWTTPLAFLGGLFSRKCEDFSAVAVFLGARSRMIKKFPSA